MRQFKIVLIVILGLFISLLSHAQNIISGKVTSTDGETLIGVNISIKDSYEGTITDLDGAFEFETDQKGDLELIVSYIGFSSRVITLNPSEYTDINIHLKESVTSLNSVTITAGSFAADDKQRASVLEPLDIYTTAGSLGDINGALKTLPGTQPASDDGRLLVRGGEASETKVFVDGLLAAKPYYSKVPDLPTRGRFAPSLFSGTVFSTGGYSAEYGQALSSVLVLESSDIALEELTSISVMSVGADLSKTWCANKRSTSIGLAYTNLAPYYMIAKNRLDWTKPTESSNLNFMHRQKFDNGSMLKIFSNADYSLNAFNTVLEDEGANIDTEGGNVYLNINYSVPFGDKSYMKSGLATTFDNYRQIAGTHRTENEELNLEARITFVHNLSEGVELKAGLADAFMGYSHSYKYLKSEQQWDGGINDHILAIFIEPEIKLSARFAIRPGLRYEYSTYLQESNIAPRMSFAYRTSKNSQLSAAYGEYYQNPVNEYLKFGTEFQFEKATHYIVSYQIGSVKERLLRSELYYKDYTNLVSYQRGSHPYENTFFNDGHGYAKGIDVFFRDRKTLKNTDYWLSYSYLDTKRLYKDYPSTATPSFISKHTFSTVGKYFIGSINTQVGATWTVASGRPYHRPDDDNFMSGKAPVYNDLSINLSYLTHIADHFTIIHFSMSNVLGRDHLVGYRTIPSYSDRQDALMPLMPDVKQFLFLGLFISIK